MRGWGSVCVVDVGGANKVKVVMSDMEESDGQGVCGRGVEVVAERGVSCV